MRIGDQQNVADAISLRLRRARDPPLDVGLHHYVIDERCKVPKQNGEHHPFRESRVHHPNEDAQGANERPVEVAPVLVMDAETDMAINTAPRRSRRGRSAN